MKSVRITRITTDYRSGTFSAVTIDGIPFCVALEPPDMANETNISSIPTGRYVITPTHSERFRKTWMVQHVANRSHILFHSGNVKSHTKGCIILAEKFGKLQGEFAVLNSGNTFRAFLQNLNGEQEAELIITESY